MCKYQLSGLSDGSLMSRLRALVARDRETTAELLAHIAEVDARKLYLPAAYPSMFAYCVGELHLSEDAAYKRIQAARVARQFPALFVALADGRLHMTGIVLLSPFLTEDNTQELLAAAAHRSKAGIEQLLAERYPRPDLPTRIQPLARPQLAPERVESPTGESQLAPERVEPPAAHATLKPLSPESFLLRVTLSRATHEKLRYIQALSGHQLPSGDVATVLDRSFDALIGLLERRKFAAARRPRPGLRRASANPRHIPADVKRQVWVRDGGRCTFVNESGRRCPARGCLEFDHVLEVARGGEGTVAGLRLRCRAHNKTGFFPAWRSSDELGQAPGCTPCREEPVELNRGG